MKLLFDENLPPRLAEVLADLYPASAHVHERGLSSADDEVIWQYARECHSSKAKCSGPQEHLRNAADKN